MKILVIFTGGTIGSRLNNMEISPDESAKYLLIEEYRKHYGNEVEFSFLEPYIILSENITAEKINLLIQTIRENINKGFDGIIVTHGTDTLQFSASALSFAFGSASIPIILVSSNYPLEDPRSDGQSHFAAAIKLIANKQNSGVVIPWCETNGEISFFRPHSVVSFAERSDRLTSLADCRYGIINTEGKFVKFPREYFLKPLNFTLSEHPGILVIDPHPADSYSYSLGGVNAIIMRPYHSGTLCTDSPLLADFCKKAQKENIPIFAVNAPSGISYASVGKFDQFGIIPLADTAYINTYVKVWIGISLAKRGDRLIDFVKE